MNTNTQQRVVIYTAIFGKKDDLITPAFVPANCDLICFTDQPFHSRVWKIRKVELPVPEDPTRSNRYYKILAHRILPEYQTSIYVDGNVLIRGDLNELIRDYLAGANMAVFDHAKWRKIPLRNLHEEMDQLYKMEQAGKHQEDEGLMRRQADAYFAGGFPDTGGLSWNCVLVRNHQESDVVRAMEMWWQEVIKWSKRDQISFNYVAWKTALRFNYIPLDGSDNLYTRRLNHRLPLLRKLYAYVLGAAKRFGHLFGGI